MAAKDDSIDARLVERVLGEYREMPGLALTIEQARQDQRTRELCKTIVIGQQQEIDQMRAILADLNLDR